MLSSYFKPSKHLILLKKSWFIFILNFFKKKNVSNETKGFKELSNEDFNVTKPNEPEKNMDKLVSNISEAFNNPTKVQAMNKGEIQAIDVVKEAINNSDSKFGDERL